ncbi:hypothetical protein CPARK_000047800 [cyanobacterium endosymbiont of Braarudosphaera bigelowii]|uniref:Uncharacterized protein n=2 Tax=Candidatus Atelocyanobacterium thalassae TaxID=713887 RepID=A0A086CFZ2_9CHRO|nr:MAG: hypothetical protein ucyna2_01096 [Candidatus Atelocyanobacterium thalassa isolate SIO64986]BDA39639.1 hypothetical protein CPARK_000047800 [cyanobacterium endosymbiont of Braarudosphaera bigelowii]
MKLNFIKWLNYLLVANIFLIFLGFFWFLIALIGHYFNLPLGLKLWYKLWTILFQPAISILFISVFVNWLIQKIFMSLNTISSKESKQ